MKKYITYNMRKYNDIIVTAVIVCLFASCSDLLEDPKNVVTEVNFYSSKGEAEAGLIGAMAQASAAADVNLGMDDISYNGYTDVNNQGYRDFPLIMASDYGLVNWTAAYKSVLNVNTVIRAANDGRILKVTESELTEILGQARFIRAFNYFNLVRLYGEVPLLKEDSPNPVTDSYSKSSIENVYALITEDLTFAIENLPDSWPDAPGRTTSWVARGLLAKVYLTMATAPLNLTDNYALAATQAGLIIASGNFALISDVADVFKIDSKRASEMMFAFEATTDAASGLPIGLASKNSGGYSTGKLDTTFAAHEFPVQPRRDAYIQLFIPDVVTNLGSMTLIPWKQAFEYAPTIAKFNYPYVDAKDILAKAVWPINIPILRYADVLLIYAKAENRVNNGPTQEAVDAINEVINRANGATGTEPVATIDMTMQAFEDKVIQERKFELCFELGSRWFDMVRKGLTEHHITTTLFPIPEFDAKLLGQNPGY